MLSSGVSLTLRGEGSYLALVSHPSSDDVTIKMPYEVDVLNQSALHPIFPIGVVKTESGFILRAVQTGLFAWL